MIRVLQILPSLNRGGAETFVMNVYRNVNRQVVQFDFLVNFAEGDYADEIKELGGKIYYIPPKRPNPIAYEICLNRFFREKSPNYVAVHMHESVLSSIEPLKYARKYKIPIRVIHAHSSSVSGSKIHYILHYLKKPMVRRWATHYLGCSDNANRWFYKYTGIYSKACFLPNGIESGNFIYNEKIRSVVRKELNISYSNVVVGHVGRIMWIKNHQFLIEIFKYYHNSNPSSTLVIVGVGPLEDDIRRKVREFGLENSVIFTGLRTDVNRLLQAFDIFVMPSFYEGLPVVLVEAQAAGLPVLCSDTISSKANLTKNFYALSLKRNPQIWSNRIAEILNNYQRKDTRKDIIEKGFDIKNSINILMSIYLSRLGSDENK